MSKLIPQSTINAIRNAVNVALDVVGIECTLYIPTNTSYNEAEKLDVWQTHQDLTYVSYSTTVFVNWNPKSALLKKFGLYVEDSLPILTQFGYKATALEGSLAGQLVDVNITRKSYFRVEPQFVPGNYEGIEEFEIVNVGSGGMHDAVLVQFFSAAPRRVNNDT